jgi:glycosyltransferase involved in cell wall biosynthesis
MSDWEPVVDVVVANHDYGRFLEAAVESACAQSYARVNVIAVDDGSSDDSREILRRYEGDVEVVLKEAGGQASALNAGIARCGGDVLMPLDADDRLMPEAAERVAEAFAADSSLSKVQFRMAVIDANGRPTGAVKPVPHLRAPAGEMRRAELAFPFDIPWLPGGGTAFRIESLRRILPIPEEDYPAYGADWYLVHLTALLGKVAALDDVCAEYRAHGGNAYELDRPDLDMSHVRDTIVFASATARHLERLAGELGLPHAEPILSVSGLAQRMISLRLEPELHPLAGDRRAALAAWGARAARRRFDVAWPMKAMFIAWFGLMTVVPGSLARKLAELFLFPERRRFLNRGLARLQRDGGRIGN